MIKRNSATLTWLSATLAGFVAVGCSLATPLAPLSGNTANGAGAMAMGKLSLGTRKFVQTGQTVIQVPYGSKSQLQHLVDSGFDVWTTQGGTAIGEASTQLLTEIKQAGTTFTMLSPSEGYTPRN